ncbi:hypothetical protein MMC18_002610 [Xylographa bjoerkii]|nr:hypothetical protein [Xylographa bjoerkii]
MRYQEAAQGPSAEVTCALDDVECTEFGSTRHRHIQECFISAETKQILKVILQLEGLHDDCQADLVVDGILRDTVTWRKKSVGDKCHIFEHGIWKGGRKTYRSPLKLAELSPGLSVLFDTAVVETTVGTIEIRIFKANPNLFHQNKVPDYNEQHNWEDSDLMPGTAGIEPTHTIVPLTLEELSESKRKTVRANFGRERPGLAPWAVFRFFYRGQKSLNDAGVLTALPASPAPTNTESTDEEQLEPGEEDTITVESKPVQGLPTVLILPTKDGAALGIGVLTGEIVQNPDASKLANAANKDDCDIMDSVEDAPLRNIFTAPVAQMTLPIAKQSPFLDPSQNAEPMDPAVSTDLDQTSKNSVIHALKTVENPSTSEHIPNGPYSGGDGPSKENQAVRGLGLELGGALQHMDGTVPSSVLRTQLSEQIQAEDATAIAAPPESTALLIRSPASVFSSAKILPVETKPSPGQDTSQPWIFPPNELRDPQSLAATDLSPSPVASPPADDSDTGEGHYSPLFVSPEPQEGLRSGDVRGSYPRVTSPISLTSNVNFNNLAPIPRAPNFLKRSFGSPMLTGQEQQKGPPPDDTIQAPKRRKTDIKALKAEIKWLAKRKVDSARRVEEARGKREEHERTLNEQYEALEREKLEVLQSIAADNNAEEDYLRGIEDDSE